MMNAIWCHPAGAKLGNATMCYLFARAHAERIGADFVCSEWIGERVFALPKHGRPTSKMDKWPVRSELDLAPDESNVRITAYAQNEKAMIYTREWARDAIQLKLPIEEVFTNTDAMEAFDNDDIVCHLRHGDYKGYGYPMVSTASYLDAIMAHNLSGIDVAFLTEERPTPHGTLPAELSFLPDFYRMAYAPVLLRGNSSFSWVAGVLNKGRVLSPVITADMEGGREHRCTFVEGNWPRLTWLEGCGDLRMKGEAA
jgi:hypothetical protein